MHFLLYFLSGGAGFGAALLERNVSDLDVISFARFALPA